LLLMSTPDQPRGVVALLLAAGSGSRFDATGRQNKLLADIDGVPVVVRAARNLINAGLPVLAVIRPTGPPNEELLEHLLSEAGCDVSVCPDAEKGMGHTLAHGVRVLREKHNPAAIVVALGDMPFIRPEVSSAVAAQIDKEHTIVAARTSGGERGHPVAFWHCHFDALAALHGDQGAGRLLKAQPPILVDAGDSSVTRDIDKPEDLPGTCR
jgi:molybdenum cofactor cytidylyltransferase